MMRTEYLKMKNHIDELVGNFDPEGLERCTEADFKEAIADIIALSVELAEMVRVASSALGHEEKPAIIDNLDLELRKIGLPDLM